MPFAAAGPLLAALTGGRQVGAYTEVHGVEQRAGECFGARLLMTHPGVGPITVLATEVFLDDPARVASSKELASYVGMIPGEYSSGRCQRLGGLTKQGNPLLRFLRVKQRCMRYAGIRS